MVSSQSSKVKYTNIVQTYHQHLTLDFISPLQTVIILARSEGLAVDICSKVAHGSLDSRIERTTIRQMPTETHARGTDAAVACWERK
jgi:hypothetical protein